MYSTFLIYRWHSRVTCLGHVLVAKQCDQALFLSYCSFFGYAPSWAVAWFLLMLHFYNRKWKFPSQYVNLIDQGEFQCTHWPSCTRTPRTELLRQWWFVNNLDAESGHIIGDRIVFFRAQFNQWEQQIIVRVTITVGWQESFCPNWSLAYIDGVFSR